MTYLADSLCDWWLWWVRESDFQCPCFPRSVDSSNIYSDIFAPNIDLGAHVTIFSRRLGPLEVAKNEIVTNCADASRQEINAVPVDLADAGAVCEIFSLENSSN